MEEKIVTFVVPAYNSALTLRHCLDSFLDKELLPHMEILVISDGSTDETSAIAKEYESKYPSFTLIEKENGGHGSVINRAAEIVKGKYFKVIDSDDTVQTANLRRYMNALRENDADAVFTNFRTIDVRNGNIREYAMTDIASGKVIAFADFWQYGTSIKNVCNFHGVTYNTKFYKQCNIKLSERISYEDQEYCTFPFATVTSVLPLDIYLYEYAIGNEWQSVSDANQVKRFGQMLQVLWRLIDEMPANISETAKSYFNFKQSEKLLSCYTAMLIKNRNKKVGRKQAKELRNELKQRSPSLFRSTARQYNICLLLSYLRFNGDSLVNLQKFRPYQIFAKYLHK